MAMIERILALKTRYVWSLVLLSIFPYFFLCPEIGVCSQIPVTRV